MTKPKLNIREMIKSGEIDTAKAGQLVSLEVYEQSDMLKESDLRALRETAKDKLLYNRYMDGINAIIGNRNAISGISETARLNLMTLKWVLAELRFTVSAYYKAQPVRILTPEAYEREGKQKRERRLKRTYTLMTLYRLLAEALIKTPQDKTEEALVEQLRKDATPEEGEDGMLYGIDLIEQGYEIWDGWTAYHKAQGFTLNQLAEDLPEAHALIMTKLKALHKAKKLSIDPESVPLDKWYTIALKGSELASLDGIPYIADCLNIAESRDNPLDEYDDEGETKEREDDLSDRALFEKYSQKYAIISRPYLYKRELKDGVLDVTEDIYAHDFDIFTRPLYGYGVTKLYSGKTPTDPDDLALKYLTRQKRELEYNLACLLPLTEWRLKAGRLLGINKGDRFTRDSEIISPSNLYDDYNSIRLMYYGAFNGEHVVQPEYQEYVNQIQSKLGVLFDEDMYRKLSDGDKAKLFKTEGASDIFDYHKNPPKDPNSLVTYNLLKDPVQLINDSLAYRYKVVSKALALVEGMTLDTIASTYSEIVDLIIPLYKDVVSNEKAE
jgi:hypothetical protein